MTDSHATEPTGVAPVPTTTPTPERYFDIFESIEDVWNEFNIVAADVTDEEIVLAAYCYEDYSGSAIVVYRREEKLFLVEGSHCSCYGLEGQWSPDETLPGALHMMDLSSYFDDDVKAALKAIQ
jgi:hypothetical protein